MRYPTPVYRDRDFLRHYGEMVLAMLLGMAVFALPLTAIESDAPALALLGMATAMTVPMVGWMRYRGHGRPASLEMAASMYLPAFAAIGLLAAGLVEEPATLMGIQHVVMFPAMLVAMLLRRDEYSHAVTA